jgi:hypothetical protein
MLLLGMCSGAYHALHASFADRRIRGLVLLNLQKFIWRDGDSISVVHRQTFRTTRFYLRNLASASTWRRLLAGEINVAGITQALAARVARRTRVVANPLVAFLSGRETPEGRMRRQVRSLESQLVPVLLMLSGNDPGLDEIGEYFGARGRQLRRQPNIMLEVLEGADHTLSAHWARVAVLVMIATFLGQRCGVDLVPGNQTDPRCRDRPPRISAERAVSVHNLAAWCQRP